MVDSKKLNCYFNKLKSFAKNLFFLFIPVFYKYYNDCLGHIKNTNVELKRRIRTAILFLVALLFVVSCGGIIYMATMFVICCIMVYELMKMVSNIEESNNRMFFLLRRWGVIYIAVSCISMVLIREVEQGLKITLWMFFVVMSVDTSAYIFGKRYGKIKLAPEISPNKTYEGAIFGTITGLFVSIALYHFFHTNSKYSFSIQSFIILSLLVIILAQLSDLSESYIKRQCKVKDSGSILPGHGGMMDRFDSYLIVAPFIYIILFLNHSVIF